MIFYQIIEIISNYKHFTKQPSQGLGLNVPTLSNKCSYCDRERNAMCASSDRSTTVCTSTRGKPVTVRTKTTTPSYWRSRGRLPPHLTTLHMPVTTCVMSYDLVPLTFIKWWIMLLALHLIEWELFPNSAHTQLLLFQIITSNICGLKCCILASYSFLYV